MNGVLVLEQILAFGARCQRLLKYHKSGSAAAFRLAYPDFMVKRHFGAARVVSVQLENNLFGNSSNAICDLQLHFGSIAGNIDLRESDRIESLFVLRHFDGVGTASQFAFFATRLVEPSVHLFGVQSGKLEKDNNVKIKNSTMSVGD